MSAESEIKLAARVIACVMIWLICAFALFRLAIPFLWGARTALAPILTGGVAVGGSVGLIYLALIMAKAVRRARSAPRLDHRP